MSWSRILFVLTPAAVAIVAVHAADQPPPNSGMADPVALVQAFDRFAAGDGDANVVTLPLGNLRGVSTEAQNARGSVRIDLAAGAVTSTLQLMPAAGTFDLWLVDNLPGDGRATLAESGDALLKVGTYALVSGRHRLSVTLGPEVFTTFYPDRAFVVRGDQSPVDGFVLTGSSTVFARLRRRQVRFEDEASAQLGDRSSPRNHSRSRFREARGPRPPGFSEGDICRQRPQLWDVSCRDQQLHRRSAADCHAAGN